LEVNKMAEFFFFYGRFLAQSRPFPDLQARGFLLVGARIRRRTEMAE
jgi:hypothetical protein